MTSLTSCEIILLSTGKEFELPRHVFHMKVRQGSEDRLRELNDQYQDALKRAMDGVPGFQSLRKYLVDDEYIEIVECDESFGEFGQAIAADPEVREFLRAVGECFEQSLRDMDQRRMECVQQIGDGG